MVRPPAKPSLSSTRASRTATTVKIVSSCGAPASSGGGCSSSDGEQSELASFFEQQVNRYAALHGLHVAISRDRTYSKTAALARAASAPPTAEWLWWLDCDSVVVDPNTSAAELIHAALLASGAPTPRLLLSYETWGSVANRGPRKHNRPINSGSFFLRNDAWGLHFLRMWSEQCEVARTRRRHPRDLLPGSRRGVWCAFKDQEVLAELGGGFRRIMPLSRAPQRFLNGSAVALPDAPFNALLCTSMVGRPAHPVVIHAARGRHALGRCDAWWSPWDNYSKVAVLRTVVEAGLAVTVAACCGGYRRLALIARMAGDDPEALDRLAYGGFLPRRGRDARVMAAGRLLKTPGSRQACARVQSYRIA